MKRFTKIMAFATAIVAIALCLCSCARSSENKANYNEDSDNTISDYSDTQTETTSIPLNEYGFNNMDEWGDALIQVTQNDNGGFVTSDNGDNYVTYNEGMGTLRFFPNNQMYVFSEYHPSTDSFEPYSEGSFKYEVLDNDNCSYGVSDFYISERIEEKGAVIMKIKNKYYIPISLIDESKEVLIGQSEYGYDAYHLKLKSK